MDILTKLYEDWSGCRPYGADLLPLSGSARKYYRITGDAGTVIGCIGTNPAENRAFLAIAERLEAAGLRAPHICAVSGDGVAVSPPVHPDKVSRQAAHRVMNFFKGKVLPFRVRQSLFFQLLKRQPLLRGFDPLPGVFCQLI